jgi:hypothetical protein
MPQPAVVRATASALCVALALAPWPSRAEETIHCSSRGLGYRYCRIDTGGHAELVRKISLFDCQENRSWGYDDHGVWVDRGCSADFRVGRRGHGREKAMVAGALVGLVALAALAKNKQQQTQDEVAAWAIGEFTGRDEVERTEVTLTILPGGSVSGHAGRSSFTGTVQAGQLQAGRHSFRIEAAGNGFMAVDTQNPQHRVQFNRVASGY